MMKIMKKIFGVIKKIIFAFLIIYSYNVIVYKFTDIIPINLATVSFVSVLGIPSLVVLIIYQYLFL